MNLQEGEDVPEPKNVWCGWEIYCSRFIGTREVG